MNLKSITVRNVKYYFFKRVQFEKCQWHHELSFFMRFNLTPYCLYLGVTDFLTALMNFHKVLMPLQKCLLSRN
ncbi:hypothetical protein KUTeg_009502 [Tegillarca granosa]|uniref:Uncharacterized protein n=1 Tax=Tegillarca granosa TaxID=220873 RepID=A0ABQ9F416_TEGGR|nr:hypothetical protein KUTeg_009502 [Tegillarca granosa]